MSDIVQKLWGFCNTLRHDGIDYGDYIEQLTYLLFLKMADEKGADIPSKYSWVILREKSGTDLADHYSDTLRNLGKHNGTLADIYAGAISKFSNPVNLKRLINLIDEIEWTGLNVDVKAAAYEGLLEKSASEGKKGAGQYFTPRILIQSIIRCMKPDPRRIKDFTIHDPAVGSGGFLVSAYEWLIHETKGGLDREDNKRIASKTYSGTELVPRPRRLALMNLYLHGIMVNIYLGDTIYEPLKTERYSCILTNPPFGTKGANQAPERDDFTISTSNKQLNFIQHVINILKPGGRAAMVLPDNCLFEDKAGEVFEILMKDCNLHTILRLPRGTFTPYSQGVKANVIFFQKGVKTENIWIFDARSNVPGITKKDRPLSQKYFEEFEKCYGSDPNGQSKREDLGAEGRFRKFSISEIKEQNYKLDITWLKDEALEDSEDLPEPQDLASEAIVELEAVVDDLREIVQLTNDKDGCSEKNALLPQGWVETTLQKAGAWCAGGTPSRRRPEFFGEGIPWVKSGDLPDGPVLKTEEEITELGLQNSSAKLMPVGTISMALYGATIGKLGIMTFSAATNQACANVIPDNRIVETNYLFYYLLSERQNFIKQGQGGAQPNISQEIVRAHPLRVAPLAEQRRIVEKLEKILKKIKVCQMRMETIGGLLPPKPQALLNRLIQSILAKAFRGELTPQDPNDEPAEKPLERIQSKHSAIHANHSKRQKREGAIKLEIRGRKRKRTTHVKVVRKGYR